MLSSLSLTSQQHLRKLPTPFFLKHFPWFPWQCTHLIFFFISGYFAVILYPCLKSSLTTHPLVERRQKLYSSLTALCKDILTHQCVLYHSNFLKYRLQVVDRLLMAVWGHLLSKFCEDSPASPFRMWGCFVTYILSWDFSVSWSNRQKQQQTEPVSMCIFKKMFSFEVLLFITKCSLF